MDIEAVACVHNFQYSSVQYCLQEKTRRWEHFLAFNFAPTYDRLQNFVNVVSPWAVHVYTDFGPDRLQFAGLILEGVQKSQYNIGFQPTISLVTYCLVFVAKASFVSFNHGFWHIRIVKVALHAPLRLSHTPALQRVCDSLVEATAFGYSVTSGLVFSVNWLAN